VTKTPSLTGITLLIVVLTLSACTRLVAVRTPSRDVAAGSTLEAADGSSWWSITFRIQWDTAQAPDWYLDALLADQVCAPALAELGPQISLWRFHRRAADDTVGHRLSLMVYSDALTADVLYQQIRETSVLRWLESDGRVEQVSMEAVERPELPSIARTSDATWPSEVQASWPWFIMGVSQTWLSLIREVTIEQPMVESSPDALLDYYRGVNNQVTTLWRDYGQHVYLHHLNALFGYQPLLIRETNLKRF
jgi:hypothetical protein